MRFTSTRSCARTFSRSVQSMVTCCHQLARNRAQRLVPELLYTALIVGQAMGLSRDELVTVQRIAGSFGLDVDQTAVGQVTDWKHCTYASCAIRGLELVKL